jgi:hypothetical protein
MNPVKSWLSVLFLFCCHPVVVLLPFSSPSPPSLSLLPVPFLPSFLPSPSHSCCYSVPLWPASVCFLPCVRRGNATQREQARATVLYSKRPRKRSPHFLHVPLVFNRLVHLASRSLRCVTRYVTNGRFPLPPPGATPLPKPRFFLCEISPKWENWENNVTTE